MRGKVIIVIAAIVVGAIAAVTAYSYLGALQRQVEAGSALVDVLVATKDIPRGVAADELQSAGYVEVTKRPLKYVSQGAISSLRSVTDRVLAVPVNQGEVLTTARFEYPSDAGLAYTVPHGYVALTVPVDDARDVAGMLKPGDRVVVYATIAGKNDAPSTTGVIVEGAKVLAVGQNTSAQGDALSSGQGTGSTLNTPQSTTPNKTVTIAVTVAESEKVVLSVESDSIWLALLPGDVSSVSRGPGASEASVLQ